MISGILILVVFSPIFLYLGWYALNVDKIAYKQYIRDMEKVKRKVDEMYG